MTDICSASKIIVIAGPTAVGKSSLSVELARKINAEIVSADSVQIYRGLDIGSAKIKESEMNNVPHYMIDELDIDESCDVLKFRDMARSYIDSVIKRGKRVIITGGTGYYIQAIVRDVNFVNDAVDEEYQKYLYNIYNDRGLDALYKLLLQNDRVTAQNIDKYNYKKVIRALEFKYATNLSLYEFNLSQRKRGAYYPYELFVLNDDRQLLYERINQRVDVMVDEGLEAEVRALYAKHRNSRILNSAIGYREMIQYINGEYSLDRAVYLIKQNTRHFAKRQLTYFKTQLSGTFINISNSNPLDEILLKA